MRNLKNKIKCLDTVTHAVQKHVEINIMKGTYLNVDTNRIPCFKIW